MRIGHSQLGKVKADTFFIQKTQYDTFTGQNRNGAYTHIQLHSAQRYIRSAILRQTAFGDIESAEQFDSGCDRRELIERNRDYFRKHTVNTAADGNRIFPRFDMDITGAEFKRAREYIVDQTDDPRFTGKRTQGIFIVGGFLLLSFVLCILQFAQQPFKEGAAHKTHRYIAIPHTFHLESNFTKRVR